MRHLSVVLLLWTSTLNAQPQEFQALIDEIVDDGRARTVVVGFYDDGETSTLVAGGPGSSSSIFEIGSITKVFTSLLVQTLVDAEKLDWDQSLSDSLPDVDFASEVVASITLRELSTHTSGLPRLPTNMSFDNAEDPYIGYDRKLLFDFLESFDPESLDKSYEYSNLGAGLLGEIAADAAGAGYAEAMQRGILAPLSMKSTTVGLRDEFVDRLVTGFSDGADMPNWSGFDALAGAGALTSSVDDMLTFIDKNLNKSAIRTSLAAIRQEQGDGTTALGWHLQKTDAGTVHWHNGGTGGYASFLGINIEKRQGVVVLSASTDYTGITDLGFVLISGQLPKQTADDFSLFEGVYELGDGFYLTVFEQGGRLHGQATGQAEFPLNHTGDKDFRFDAASIVIRFPERIDNHAASILFSQGGSEITAPRVDDALGTRPFDEIDVKPEALKDYVGKYQLAPGATITVDVRGGQLFAQLTGQQSFPVFPFEPDKFFYKVVDAKLYFGRNDDGRVVSVTLDQAGLRLAPRID
jgi:CubicO group peptidase (beta-lactamase class C family)